MCLPTAWVLRLLFGLRAVNVPRLDGAFILAPNHLSYMDPMVVQVTFPRHVTFLMAGHIFRVRRLSWFYRFWRAIPLDEGRVVAGAMKSALGAARAGQVVGIFPEGRISEEGVLQRGREGVATLMQRARVPVVPVAIIGTYGVLPKRARLPRPGRIRVVYGDPIDPSEIAAEDRKEAAAELKDRVMTAIAQLLEQHRPR